MLCRCKYSTSLILILIISTPDVSCKHFISHGLSVEPLVLLQLYLQMPHPANAVQEEFNSEKESREAPASVCFKRCFPLQVLCSWGFFKSISKQALYICKSVHLENTLRQRPPPCCLGLAHAAPPRTHWSRLPRVRAPRARLGAHEAAS